MPLRALVRCSAEGTFIQLLLSVISFSKAWCLGGKEPEFCIKKLRTGEITQQNRCCGMLDLNSAATGSTHGRTVHILWWIKEVHTPKHCCITHARGGKVR